jgi:hypothetical protein
MFAPGGVLAESRPAASLYRHREAFVAADVLVSHTLEQSFVVADGLRVLTNEVLLTAGLDYDYDPVQNTVRFHPPLPRGTHVLLEYDALALGVAREYVRDIFRLSVPVPLRAGLPEPLRPDTPPTPAPGVLNVSGAKTFGISAGNRRSFAPDQSLRLNVEGEIVPGVSVLALLSDQQLPIQPEGTTEELDRLDQMLIRLQGRAFSASLGDDEARLERAGLVLSPRTMQGVQARGEFGAGNGQFFVALPKGESASATFVGVDGQRQYRIAPGGRYVVVVAGSEQVWLNGVPMRRGETQDYIVRDYGDPVIEFTPTHLITRNDVIRVDFEYRQEDEGWQRNLYGARTGLRWLDGRGELGVAYASEADVRSRPLFPLTDVERELLRRGVTTTPDERVLTPPLQREILGFDAGLRLGRNATLNGEWALRREDENTFDATDRASESAAWRLAAEANSDAFSVLARAHHFGAAFRPIGATVGGRTRADYTERFRDEGFGDALLDTGFADSPQSLPAESRADVRASVAPARGVSLSATAGITDLDHADESPDSLRRNWGSDVWLRRSGLPRAGHTHRESDVRTANRQELRKSEDTWTLGYAWRLLDAEHTRRSFRSEDLDIADGANRNLRHRSEVYRLRVEPSEALSAGLRWEREDAETREPVLAAQGIPIGYGAWRPSSGAGTYALDFAYRLRPVADASLTLARRTVQRPGTNDADLTTNLANAQASWTPFRRAIDLDLRYQLDRRLTSRRVETFTNVVVVDGVPARLQPGQGTHVRIDDRHYEEDFDRGDYIRLLRTTADTPVAAAEAQVRVRVDPAAYRTPPQTSARALRGPSGAVWSRALAALWGEARWTLTEEQEDSSLQDLVLLRGLRQTKTVFGRGLSEYRLRVAPWRNLTLDADWTGRATLDRRLNSEERRLEGDALRLRLRGTLPRRWTAEATSEKRLSVERFLPAGGVRQSSSAHLRREERQDALTVRHQWSEQWNFGVRLVSERERARDLARSNRPAETDTAAAEALLTWSLPGRGRADAEYRIAWGDDRGEPLPITLYRFYPGLSHEATLRGDYRVRSFTDLTFRAAYRMIAAQRRSPEHRLNVELVAEL